MNENCFFVGRVFLLKIIYVLCSDWNGVVCCLVLWWIICKVFGWVIVVIIGIFFLIILVFFLVIFLMVFFKMFIWLCLMFVIIVKSGLIIFVELNFFFRFVLKIIKLILWNFVKYKNVYVVIILNFVGCLYFVWLSVLMCGLIWLMSVVYFLFEIGVLLILICLLNVMI